jgi:hypothetical protein
MFGFTTTVKYDNKHKNIVISQQNDISCRLK